MTRTGITLAAVICLGLVGPAAAQTERIQREVDEKLRQRRLYEDAEIMRRLLQRALHSAYGFYGTDDRVPLLSGRRDPNTGAGRGDAAGPPLAVLMRSLGQTVVGGSSPHHHAGEIEGTYLKGHGVVYSVTLPRPMHDPRPEPAKAAGATLSDWERLRRELRGEKVDGGSGSPARKDPRIADVVLKVLADNGRHFAHLAADEQMTVAVTFRGQACTACHGGGGAEGGMSPFGAGFSGGPGGMGMPFGFGRSYAPSEGGVPSPPGAPSAPGLPGGGGPGGAFPPGAGSLDGGGSPSGAPAGGPAGPGGVPGIGVSGPGAGRSGNPAISSKLHGINNHALLGDLHFRQGRHRDAVTAYEEAATLYRELPHFLGAFANVTRQQHLQTYLAGTELYGKIAQSYLALGEEKKALEATQRFAEAAREAERLTLAGKGPAGGGGSKRPQPAAIPLAPKLIISAPKKLLDQVGAGKMTFEEFKKAAAVEYLEFDTQTGGGDGPVGTGSSGGPPEEGP